MKNINVELMPNLTKAVVGDITGFKLCSYLVALEGWRRGLKLTWYKDETSACKMHRAGGSTQGKFFSLSSNERTHYFFRSRGDKVANKAVTICQKKEETKEIKKYANFSLSSSSLTTIDLNLYISNSIPFLPTISNKRINYFSIYPFIFIFYYIYIFYQ